MEIKLERYNHSNITGNGSYKNLYELCSKLHNIVDKDEFIKENWNNIVYLTHSTFKKKTDKALEKDNIKTTNAFWKMLEIWSHFKFNYQEIHHFDIACAPGYFIFAMQDITNKLNIKYNFKGFTLKEGLELDNSLKESNNIFYHNILTDKLPEEYYGKFNFITGDIGIETNYDSIEEIQLIELEKRQLETALKLASNGASIILKMFTYSQKETIRIVDEFSKHFNTAYIYKPYSSRILNNESYLVGIHYDVYSCIENGSNAELIEYFENERQKMRLETLDAAIKLTKIKQGQYLITKLYDKLI